MRIVVTGPGHVGRHVVAELASRGHEVAAVDRVDRPADLAAGVRSWTIGDVGEPALMAGVMASARPDALVHLAAIPRPSLGTPLEVFATNTQATFVALETAGEAGVRRVAIASSTSALGMVFARRPVSPLYVPVDEAHLFVGSDPYALSKQVDEATAATMSAGTATRSSRSGSRTRHPCRTRSSARPWPRGTGEFASQLWAYLEREMRPGRSRSRSSGPARLSRDQRDGPGHDLARADRGPAGALPSDIRHQACAARPRGPV